MITLAARAARPAGDWDPQLCFLTASHTSPGNKQNSIRASLMALEAMGNTAAH